MLRDLRGDYSSSFGGWGRASRAIWLTSVANSFEERIISLAKQKTVELTSQEELAERAAMGTETEEVRLL